MIAFRKHRSLVCWCLPLAILGFAGFAHGQAETCWTLMNGDCQLQILKHVRASEPACDDLWFVVGQGTQSYAYLSTSRVRVIPELKIAVPVLADRTGMQVLVRVVLPRSINPVTQSPYTVLVAGSSYRARSQWQTLFVQDIPDDLDDKLRILQLTAAQAIDAREAYVDMVLVNVYGGPGNCRVRLGDVAMEGDANASAVNGYRTTVKHVSYVNPERRELSSHVQINGGLLQVDGRPFVARMIDDNGEDWRFLRELGFNTVRLTNAATLEQTATAEELGLWLVCPPPSTAVSRLSAVHFRRVIAWDLGGTDPDATPQQLIARAEMIHRFDQVMQVPTLTDTPLDPRLASRAAEIVVHFRPTLGTPFSLTEYADWISRRVDGSHPSAVHWVAVDTQPPLNLRRQMAAFGSTQPVACEVNQLLVQTQSALSRNIRGIYFRCSDRLSANDRTQDKRVLAIRKANLLLDILQPWFAAGHTSAVNRSKFTHSTPARTSLIQVQKSTLEQATLFSVVRTTATSQFCPDAPALDLLPVVLQGVTDIDYVFQLTPACMQPLATNRVAGGVEVQIELWANTGLVLVTRDPAIVREMAESLNRSTRVTAEITAQQINLELADEQLRATDDGQTLNTDSLEEAKNDFLRALGQKAYAECHRLGKDLLHQIAQRRYDDWCALTQPFSSPADCPLAAQACLRPLLSQMRRRVDLQAPSINLLPAGGCDDIQTMIDAGWQVTVAEHQQATATALIDPENVHHGPGCLCLTAPLPLSEQELASDELPLIWASSPSAKIASNQIFRIDGWVRYECYDAAACLLVFDSLTGPSCGPRIRPTEQWVPFSLYRATDLDSPVSVTFALTAPGRVWIDDVSITPIVSADSLKGGE